MHKVNYIWRIDEPHIHFPLAQTFTLCVCVHLEHRQTQIFSIYLPAYCNIQAWHVLLQLTIWGSGAIG